MLDRRSSARWFAAALTTVALALGAADVRGKAGYDSTYGFDRTWNAALRLVRIDNGWKLTEKDEAAGYLLFDYRSPEAGPKATQGSVEVVRGKEATEPVHVVVQLPQMPHYHEQVLLDALVRKLRADYGDPPLRPRASARDAGAFDAGE